LGGVSLILAQFIRLPGSQAAKVVA